jgi:hypothetical protein
MNRRDLEEELTDLRNDRAAVLFNARKAVCGARRPTRQEKRDTCGAIEQLVDDLFFEMIDAVEEQIREIDAAAHRAWEQSMRSE